MSYGTRNPVSYDKKVRERAKEDRKVMITLDYNPKFSDDPKDHVRWNLQGCADTEVAAKIKAFMMSLIHSGEV